MATTTTTTQRIVAVLALVAALAAPGAALAQQDSKANVSDKNALAIGGEAGASNSGLSVKYAIGYFQLQLIVGADMFFPTDSGSDEVFFSTSLRFTYAIARSNNTNFNVGAGATLTFGTEPLQPTVDLMIGVEHFFSEFFSVSGHVGIPIRINSTRQQGTDSNGAPIMVDGVGVEIASFGWGLGFHFYF